MAALRATFTELDADGSGAISAAELAAALRQLGTAEGSIQQEAQQMIEVGGRGWRAKAAPHCGELSVDDSGLLFVGWLT